MCLNCGAPLSGSFCAACGQRDIPPHPSVRELAVDAISEFSGWDGRLSSTLRTLIRQPGKLTHDFLEGRRARYISPLRLYLTAILVYFVLAAAVLWIPIYATLAFRRVYGGSLGRTLMKEVGIGAIYGLTAVVPFVVMIYWVSIAA